VNGIKKKKKDLHKAKIAQKNTGLQTKQSEPKIWELPLKVREAGTEVQEV
jgi:hypothetical protein